MQFVSETHFTHEELKRLQASSVQLSPPPQALHFSMKGLQSLGACVSEHVPTFVVGLMSLHVEPEAQFWFEVQPLAHEPVDSWTQY